ncbi:MAG: tannase/feruloyl esterase family alpha/beta hydrolase [Clostridiales bacterium]|nr:tannase/feruloyl esterase family alpha/beta hydrolase [Clostridiales bacterium]
MNESHNKIENLRALASDEARIEILERFPGGTFVSPLGDVLENMPPFTRVRLILTPAARSYIVSEIWLPDHERWNGRYLGTGVGGFAGKIHYKRIGGYLKRGYAVSNTDLGTSRGVLSGVGNRDEWADYGWRAAHLTAVYSKRAVPLFYGRPAVKNYYLGSSTAGQQAFSEAQRFPEDYDGIYAGVPAFSRTALHTYFLWDWLAMRNEEGGPLFGEEEPRMIYDCAVVFFKENGDPGKEDYFISRPWLGDDTVPLFIAYLKEHCHSLSKAQLDGLTKYYSGPVDPVSGKRIYCGVPIGCEITPGGIMRSCADICQYFFIFIWAFGADYKPSYFNFGSDFEKLNSILGPDLNATNPDLSAFAARGGKMIGFSGSADATVPYPESLDYYDRAAEKCGGYEKLGEFFRYYMLPGRSHTAGIGADDMFDPDDEKRSVNALRALERWVEDGVVPDGLVAVSKPKPEVPGKHPFERMIYPYGISDKCLFNRDNHPSGCGW